MHCDAWAHCKNVVGGVVVVVAPGDEDIGLPDTAEVDSTLEGCAALHCSVMGNR